jgi:hypothetical protein
MSSNYFFLWLKKGLLNEKEVAQKKKRKRKQLRGTTVERICKVLQHVELYTTK